MSNLLLSEIWIYPVKSLGGIRMQQANVLEKGLQYDRRWMLVDEQGAFMTQRVFPRMALFKVKLENDELSVYHHGDRISIPSSTTDNASEVKIWDDSVTALEVSQEHNVWFSERLDMKCKLVFFPEKNARPINPRYQINDENVSLADASPFLIIGQRALDFLNTKLDEPLPMNRFRPNFVFTGGEPNEEDSWKNFSIGDNRFVAIKPCARCVLTTINQDTAEKGQEPLRTLTTYRKTGSKILFGQDAVAIDHKVVKQGDSIIVQDRK